MARRPLLLLVGLGVLCFGAVLAAQSPRDGASAPGESPSPAPGSARPMSNGTGPTVPAASGSTRERPPSETRERASGESDGPFPLIYLKDQDGRLVPVPLDGDLQDYLRSKRAKAEPAKPTEAPFSVSSVTLRGEADDDRALMTATIRIRVNEGSGWVRVPLAMQEAVLLDTAYKGPGEESFDKLDREAGHRWWLRGSGDHELIWTLSVPIRKQGAGRRVQLSLPAAAVSLLTLTTPGQATAVRALPEGTLVRSTVEGTQSVLKANGLGNRLDLSWQPVSTDEPTRQVLQAETSIALDVAEESLVLDVDQAVEAVDGSFQELRVRMPAGFEFLNVEEKYGRVAASRPEAPDRPDWILVQLTEPTKGPVLLHWTLEGSFPKGAGRVTVDGFEVAQAVRQSGEVLIGPADGFRITRRDGDGGYVHRAQPSPARATKPWSSAWRFLKQPFKLELDVREVEPYYTVEPRWKLHVSGAAVELAGSLTVHVPKDRGAVQSLSLDWPAWKSDGWLLQAYEGPTIVQRIDVEDADSTTRLRVRLDGRKSGSFSVPLRARRPLGTAGPEGNAEFEVNLPAALPLARGASVIDVSCDENLETDVRRAPPIVGPALADVPKDEPPPSDDRAPNWSRTWKLRVDDPYPRLVVRTIRHSRAVRCDSLVEARLSTGGPDASPRLHVAQRMRFQILYEPLGQVRLLVPREIVDSLSVLANDVDPLPLAVVSTGLDADARAVVRVALPRPMTGELTLVARYAVDLAGAADKTPAREVGASTDVPSSPLPILIPEETSVTATRFRLFGDGVRTVDLVDDRVHPVSNDRDGAGYLASGAMAESRVRIDAARRGPVGALVVQRQWVRTWLDPSGAAAGKTWMRLDGASPSFPVVVPRGVELFDARWNDEPIPPDRLSRDEPDDTTGVVRHHVALDASESAGVLTLNWQQNDVGRPGAIRSPELLFPMPDAGVPVRETAWEILLPAGQHLLVPPEGFSARFDWHWVSTHFRRRVQGPVASVDRWLEPAHSERGAAIARSASDPSVDGPRYVFTRVGGLESAKFQTISFAMLVLVGAGAAWLGGLVLIKIPAARNLFVLLSFCLLVVVGALYFPESFALLAQPAVAGLALATLMGALERRLASRHEPPVLTISHASDPGRPAARASSVARIVTGADPRGDLPRGEPPRPESAVDNAVGQDMASVPPALVERAMGAEHAIGAGSSVAGAEP